eukprot:CAMPEP_0202912362 /NCGR_PEP_ID=MMETSP1392-20130828/57549_1 /ASSEMBLY_ACC=CAM_ASM_000868 /TAXON_ID=225041 /ORGANISM="Chlamydomonas chlamydogama, Strain SAG 11-48b" /LENGTH=305 /DNA_ID=CAMNT_0049603235 /DNA_START=252 /DNA_END=1165 /DNA_ORIENTATION=+
MGHTGNLYGVLGAGANLEGVLNAIIVSDPPEYPQLPELPQGPCLEGNPFAVDETKWKLERKTRDNVEVTLFQNDARRWCEMHGRMLPPAPLSDKIERAIKEWFDLVDYDGSGCLRAEELVRALQAAKIPFDLSSITEMVRLMDLDRDDAIDWKDFHNYISCEVQAGKDVLGSEFILPSGLVLPLGSMISNLRRKHIMGEIMDNRDGGRARWVEQGSKYLADMMGLEDEALRARMAAQMERAKVLQRLKSCRSRASSAGVARSGLQSRASSVSGKSSSPSREASSAHRSGARYRRAVTTSLDALSA